MKRPLAVLALVTVFACDGGESPLAPPPPVDPAPQLGEVPSGEQGVELVFANFFNHLSGQAPVQYGLGMALHAWGDFKDVTQEDVTIEVAGQVLVPTVVVLTEMPAGFTLVSLEGISLGGPPSSGTYVVTVTDDNGLAWTSSLELKEFNDHTPEILFPQWLQVITDDRPTFTWALAAETYDGAPTPLVGQQVWMQGLQPGPPGVEATVPTDETSIGFDSPFWNQAPESLAPGLYNLGLMQAYTVTPQIRFEHIRTVTFRVVAPNRITWAEIGLQYGFLTPGSDAFTFHGYSGRVDLVGDFSDVTPTDITLLVNGEPLPELEWTRVDPPQGGDVRIEFFGRFPEGGPPLGTYQMVARTDPGDLTAPFPLGALSELPTTAPTLSTPHQGAVVPDGEPTFTWEAFQLVYAGRVLPVRHYAVSVGGAQVFVDPDEHSLAFGDPRWEPPRSAPLAPGEHRVEINTLHFVTTRLHLIPHRAAAFVVQSPPVVEHAGLTIHSFPAGDGATGPEDHWFRARLYLDGDYGGLSPEDVRLTVDGDAIPVADVWVYPGDGVGYAVEVAGDFGGEPAPLGHYEIAARDADGTTTEPFDLGVLEGRLQGMPHPVYPAWGTVVLEAEPTFRWDPGNVTYLGVAQEASQYHIRLYTPDAETYLARPLPGSFTELPYQNPFWEPSQPAPMGGGEWELGLVGVYQVLPRIQFSLHEPFPFYRPPETLVVHPEPRPLSEAGMIPMDYIARDEEALVMALRLAQPGEVIGIDGMITLKDLSQPVGVRVEKDGVTITGARAASGLRADAGKPVNHMVVIYGAEVSVSHLRIDASGGVLGATVLIQNTGTLFGAAGTVIADNDVICGRLFCVAVSGAAASVITRNRMAAEGVVSAVRLQGVGAVGPDGIRTQPVDRSRVEDNVIAMGAPRASPSATAGGIYVRDGRDVRIVGNTITGPFPNSISSAALRGSLIEKNRTSGATSFALLLDGTQGGRIEDVLLKNNHFNDAGVAGGYVNGACSLTFVGNNLSGNPDNVGLAFDIGTGASAVAGNGSRVLDQGATDCDGDGVVDPNQIAGAQGKTKGVQFGKLISEAIQRIKESLAGGTP